MPDTLEAVRKNVQEKAIDESAALEGQDPLAISMRRVAPAQADVASVEVEDAIVRQGHAVGVPREVVQDTMGSGGWGLGVHDPLVLAELPFECCEAGGVGFWAFRVYVRAQPFEDLAPKHPREGADRKQEAARCLDPATCRGIEPACGHDAMQVDVKAESLIPGVEHRHDSRVGAEMFRVVGEVEQRRRGRAKKRLVDEARALSGKAVEGVREREHDMGVVHGKQFGAPGCEPALLGENLALRTMAVATGPIDRALMAAGRAHLEVAAHLRRAASRDRSQSHSLLPREPMSLGHGPTFGANDVGEFGASMAPAVPAARRHRYACGGSNRSRGERTTVRRAWLK